MRLEYRLLAQMKMIWDEGDEEGVRIGMIDWRFGGGFSFVSPTDNEDHRGDLPGGCGVFG